MAVAEQDSLVCGGQENKELMVRAGHLRWLVGMGSVPDGHEKQVMV